MDITERKYLIAYTGSTDCCEQVNRGYLLTPHSIETEEDIARIEMLINKTCLRGHRKSELISFSLMSQKQVEKSEERVEKYENVLRLCGG